MNADFSPAKAVGLRFPSPEREGGAIEARPSQQPAERLPHCPIAGLEPCSLLDFPGHLAAVIFLGGCNLNCGYCHNRSLIKPSNNRDIMNLSGLLSFLNQRRSLLDGVVISGGEPTLHADLPDFIALIRLHGYKVKLDTNGTNPELLRQLLDRGLLDYLAMDIKAAPQDPALYSRVSGCAVDTQAIRVSLALIRGHAERNPQFNYEFRTTACPELGIQDLMGIGAAIAGAPTYALQVCRPHQGLSHSTLEEVAALIGPMYGIGQVLVR